MIIVVVNTYSTAWIQFQFNVDTLFGQLTFLSSSFVGLDSIVLDSAGQYMITSPEFELGPGFEIKLCAEFETSSASGCP